jgi:hypothetical protein
MLASDRRECRTHRLRARTKRIFPSPQKGRAAERAASFGTSMRMHAREYFLESIKRPGRAGLPADGRPSWSSTRAREGGIL